MTQEPFRVPEGTFALCAPAVSALQETRGPHFVPAIKVYANPVAHDHIRAGRIDALPVGATIVKEKWWNEDDGRPTAYAAMIKREPGYDAPHGDWEYLFVDLGDERRIERGRLASCIKCHSAAASQDYLFRTYLGVQARPQN